MRGDRGSGWVLLVQDTAPESLLNELTAAHILFQGAEPVDAVTVCLQVPYGQIAQVRQVLDSRGSDLRVCRPFGVRPRMLQLGKRYGLLIALFICSVLLAASNLFVWRIDVTGNEKVPTGAVIRAASEVGAGIGSFWPAFDSEQLKTDLLLRLQDVQWIGVNYKSGVIEIVVREQRETPKVVDNDEPMHIVAEKSGIVTAVSAKQGQNKIGVGDTVEKGQVLISGIAESPIGTSRGVHALGTVEARTWYTITAKQPTNEWVKHYMGRRSMKISLILGEKRLNFYPKSSIFGDSCDTIIMDYHLCMEGVFSLPVHIVVQQCVYWTAQEQEVDASIQEETARHALMEVLEQRIGEDGSVTTTEFAALARSEGMTVTMMAECVEKIGEEVSVSEEELRQIQQDNTLREEATND